MSLKLAARSYELLLNHPFTISRSTRTTQATNIVAISDGNVTGYGEVIPYPFYGITNDKIQQSFKSVNDIINNALGKTPEQLWEILSSELKDDYFSLCALDCAYWDYYAKSQNRTIRSYFVHKFRELPLSNFPIGIDTVEIMIQKMKKT